MLKLVVLFARPSETVSVIVMTDELESPVTGKIETVREEPLPLIRIPAFCTTVKSLETPVTPSVAGSDSASPTVKGDPGVMGTILDPFSSYSSA